MEKRFDEIGPMITGVMGITSADPSTGARQEAHERRASDLSFVEFVVDLVDQHCAVTVLDKIWTKKDPGLREEPGHPVARVARS